MTYALIFFSIMIYLINKKHFLLAAVLKSRLQANKGIDGQTPYFVYLFLLHEVHVHYIKLTVKS